MSHASFQCPLRRHGHDAETGVTLLKAAPAPPALLLGFPANNLREQLTNSVSLSLPPHRTQRPGGQGFCPFRSHETARGVGGLQYILPWGTDARTPNCKLCTRWPQLLSLENLSPDPAAVSRGCSRAVTFPVETSFAVSLLTHFQQTCLPVHSLT